MEKVKLNNLYILTILTMQALVVNAQSPPSSGVVTRPATLISQSFIQSPLSDQVYYYCPNLIVDPVPAGICSTGLTYCRYMNLNCHSVRFPSEVPGVSPTNPLNSLAGITIQLTFECDSEGGKCPTSIECAKRELSANIRSALDSNRPRPVAGSTEAESPAEPARGTR
jgi:hypothetical protein